jgi:hypothetical protein
MTIIPGKYKGFVLFPRFRFVIELLFFFLFEVLVGLVFGVEQVLLGDTIFL